MWSQLGTVTVSREFDALGRQKALRLDGESLPAVSFTYQGLGGPVQRQDASALRSTYAYDALDRVIGISDQKITDGTPVATWRWEVPLDGVPRLGGLRKGTAAETASIYETDLGGRLTAERHAVPSTTGVDLAPTASTSAANTAVAGYLTGSTVRRYLLDSRNNWLSRTVGSTVVGTARNSADAYSIFGAASATYDDGGALLADPSTAFTYDAFGAVSRVTTATQDKSFRRDALGRIVVETNHKTNQTTRYAYDGLQRTFRKQPNGTVDVTIDGASLDEHLIRVDSAGTRLFYHADRQGSAYMLSNTSGNPVEWYEYTAYGDLTIRNPAGLPLTASAIANRFGFQGHPHDPALGLVDMRARHYRPSWGRFLTRDPIGYLGGANLYAFVDSAPLAWTDPLGLYRDCPGCHDRPAVAPPGPPTPQQILSKQYTPGVALMNAILKAGVEMNSFELDLVNDSFDGVATDSITGQNAYSGNGGGTAKVNGVNLIFSVIEGHETQQTLIGYYVENDGATSVAFTREGSQVSRPEFTANGWVEPPDLLPSLIVDTIVSGGLGLFRGMGRGAAKEGATEFSRVAKNKEYVPDLSQVTGKTARERNRWIKATIAKDLPDLRLTYVPKYNPFLSTFGIAEEGLGSQVGSLAFQSQRELIDTIVHEELHHRWWLRGIPVHHGVPKLDKRFEATVERYMRMRGFK